MPLNMRCPDCKRPLVKIGKGWECTNLGCLMIRIRCGNPWGEPKRIQRAARARATPLTDVDLAALGLHP